MAMGRDGRSRLAMTATGLLTGLLGLGACGSDVEGDDYSGANRDAFVAACTSSEVDDRLIRDVCECTWDRIEGSLPYPRFAEIEEALRLDTLAPLPDEVTDLIAECFLSEAEL
jgi:hypothetical protein